MFKKLKDKIAEEVKSSPQRVQQLAKSVVGNNTSVDDNMFSIDEETAVNSFNSSPSPLPSYNRTRRDSNSSFASDVSFLPNYESPGNLYHLQSDLDVSASEVEDSSIGAGDAKQLMNAYRNVLAKYNKYRGRYSDLANHYRILERENAKTKGVLVETQDKALRRVAELKEQCQLEQNAKAHIEQVLREDLNERQILIDTLNQKIQLLQESNPSNTTTLTLDQDDLIKIRTRNQELEEKIQEIMNTQTNDVESVRSSMKQKLQDLEIRLQDSQRESENKLDAREKEIQRLQALKANEFELQQTITQLKNENTSLNAKIKDLEKSQVKVNDLTAEIKAIKMMSDEKCKEMERTISSLETEKNSLQAKLKESLTLQDKVDDLVAELKATKVIQVQSEENVKSLENTLKSKENQLQQQNIKLNETTQEYSAFQAEYESLLSLFNSVKNNAEKQTNDQNRKDEEFSKVLHGLLEKSGIQTKENILENKNKLLLQVRNYLEHKETELKNISATCNTLNEKITELLKTSAEKQNALELKDKEIEHLKKKLNETQNTESSVKEEKESLNSDVQNLQKICEDQKSALTNSATENQKLMNKVESLQTLVHDSKSALTNITKEKDKLNNEVKQLRHSFENIESNLLNSVAEKEKLLRDVSKYKKMYEDKEHQLKLQINEHQKLEIANSVQESDKKLQSVIDELKTNLDCSVQERDQLIEEMNKLQKEFENKDIFVKNMSIEHSKLQETQQSEFKKLKEEIENLSATVKQLEVLLETMTQDKNHLIVENQNYITEINNLKEQHSDNQNKLNNEIKTIIKYRDDLNTELLELKDLFEKQHAQLLNESEDKKMLQLNLQEQNKKCEDLLKEIDVLKQTFSEEKSEIMTITAEKTRLEELNNQLQLKLTQTEGIVVNLQKEIQELKDKDIKYNEIQLDLKEKIQLINKADEEINKLMQTLNEKQNEISDLKQDDDKRNELYDELQSKYTELNRQLQVKAENLSKAEEEIENLNISFNNEKSNLNTLKTENNSLQETVKQLQLLLNEKDNKLEDLSNELENTSINNNQYLELEEKLEQKTNLLLKSEENIQEIKQQFNDLETQNNNLLKELSKTDTLEKLKDFEEENNKLRQMYEDTAGKLKNIEVEFSRLVDERENSVQFYQNQIHKLQNKNEKLESKLDETLITLNHCTELSSSTTEMQYLKNILYNYMMGKESIVLARVIAAVCKFDAVQTESVIQKEQQKQTLFGHFGL